jgi:hypothetical protein
MVLHSVVEEEETEEVLVVVRTEVVTEEVNRIVVVKDNNLTDQIRVEVKATTRVKQWDYLSSRYNHKSSHCK